MPQGEAPKLFCTAPWTEGHLYNDGQLRPCDHNQESLGQWQRDGLAAAWQSPRYQEFRRQIANGAYPNEQCRSCHLNQSNSHLGNHIALRFEAVRARSQELFGREFPELSAISALFSSGSTALESWQPAIDAFLAIVPALRAAAGAPNLPFLEQLERIVGITLSFLRGETMPPIPAPVRQVRLINKCNARCIMCAGNFNGDIVNGPGLDDQFLPEALHGAEDLLSFASETSEFLLYKNWKEVVERLCATGLPKLRVYTNGILLTPENVRHLIARQALDILHVSMNGASREILETNQINVKFDKLLENVRYFFEHATATGARVQTVFSFIIMRRNHHQMAEFVRLIHGLRKGYPGPAPAVYFAYLDANNEAENYREFLFREHHSLVEESVLDAKIREAAATALELGLPAMTCEGFLDEFVRQGRRPPKLVCKETDTAVLARYLEKGGSPSIFRSLLPANDHVAARIRELQPAAALQH